MSFFNNEEDIDRAVHAIRREVRESCMKSVVFVFLLIVSSSGFSQDYPNKPLRLIVPYGVGGGSDYVGRIVAQKLAEQMGQPVVVDNRTGAASLVGTELAARAAPDGYTLLLADSALTINPRTTRT